MNFKIKTYFISILFIACHSFIKKTDCELTPYITYHKNGKPELLGHVDCEKKLHGIQYHFFETGDTAYKENYNHGVLDGIKIRWHENRVKASLSYYEKGTLLQLKMWEIDGTLILDTVYSKSR